MRIKTMLLVVSMSFLMCFMNPMEVSACRPQVFEVETSISEKTPLILASDIHTTKGKIKKTKKYHRKKHQVVEKWISEDKLLSGFIHD